jgi:hypothetical protein
MVKVVDKSAAGAALPLPDYSRPDAAAQHDSTQIEEIVAGAIERLHRDLDSYNPAKHAIAFALAGETHKAMQQQWSEYPFEAQAALWTALQEAATGLLQQLQARSARIVPANGFMYGLQDEAIKLEVQAEIILEEIHRTEAELRRLNIGEVLQ